MVDTKATVQRVLEHLPDDCTMHEVLDRLAYIEKIQQRLDLASAPDAQWTSQDDIERKVAQWVSQSDG